MGFTQGEKDFAVRRALNLFDRWNDVAGAFAKFTGYYYEVQACIEEAVECGFQSASGDISPIDEEEPIKPPKSDNKESVDNTQQAQAEIAWVNEAFDKVAKGCVKDFRSMWEHRKDAVVQLLSAVR